MLAKGSLPCETDARSVGPNLLNVTAVCFLKSAHSGGPGLEKLWEVEAADSHP